MEDAFVALAKETTNKQPIYPSKTLAVTINDHFSIVKACSENFRVCNGWAPMTTRTRASSTMSSKHGQSRDTQVDTHCVLGCKRGIDHRSSIKRVKQGCERLSLRIMADHCKSGSYHIHATWALFGQSSVDHRQRKSVVTERGYISFWTPMGDKGWHDRYLTMDTVLCGVGLVVWSGLVDGPEA